MIRGRNTLEDINMGADLTIQSMSAGVAEFMERRLVEEGDRETAASSLIQRLQHVQIHDR